MKRGLTLGFLLLAVWVPSVARARIDLTCSTPQTATSVISGVVKNVKGELLPGMRVELYQANSAVPLPDVAETDAQGRYRICVGTDRSGHDTYDVHVKDLSAAPRYASINQPYTTYTNLTGDADFTVESGYPMRSMANLRITPNAISTTSGDKPVEWTVRSKAPSDTVMDLTLSHLKDSAGNDLVETMPFVGTEDGGPAAGGWNVWRIGKTIARYTPDRLNVATAAGREGSLRTTQMDRQPYVFDNLPPLFGGGGPTTTTPCGGSLGIKGFSPPSPPGTTNPLPVVVHGACDPLANGARSGINPFKMEGTMCRDADLSVGCIPISPILNANSIVWYPASPLQPGDYYFQWTAVDFAGNMTRNPSGYKLTITDHGGQTPRFTAPKPGNSGGTQGFIVGSSLTTPPSVPYVGFIVTDADGQTDMIPGSLVVKVFYGDERTLEYEYDSSKGPNDEPDPLYHKGGGTFDLSNGQFRATGYSLQYRKPGRYVASAAITDYGGNTATFTWNWILVAAA